MYSVQKQSFLENIYIFCLPIGCGCFHAHMVELHSYARNHVANKKRVFTTYLFTENVNQLDLGPCIQLPVPKTKFLNPCKSPTDCTGKWYHHLQLPAQNWCSGTRCLTLNLSLILVGSPFKTALQSEPTSPPSPRAILDQSFLTSALLTLGLIVEAVLCLVLCLAAFLSSITRCQHVPNPSRDHGKCPQTNKCSLGVDGTGGGDKIPPCWEAPVRARPSWRHLSPALF